MIISYVTFKYIALTNRSLLSGVYAYLVFLVKKMAQLPAPFLLQVMLAIEGLSSGATDRYANLILRILDMLPHPLHYGRDLALLLLP